MKTLREKIGQRIRQARQEKGLSQRGLGKLFGASHATISDMELGKPRKLDVEDLVTLARILDKPIAYFLSDVIEVADKGTVESLKKEAQQLLARIEELEKRLAEE